MTRQFALGKLPAQLPYGVAYHDDYLVTRPPQPAAVVESPRVAAWGMDGNDTIGDCVIAGSDHLILASDTQLGQRDPVATTQQCCKEYFLQTGGVDSGLVISNNLQKWQTVGLFDNSNKIEAYAPIRLSSILALHRAIDLYGFALGGVQLPESAMVQFNHSPSLPWTVEKGSQIIGGHCILFTGYNSTWLELVTWGALHRCSYAWYETYCDEVWAVISQEAVKTGHGPGNVLDLAALKADLSRLSVA